MDIFNYVYNLTDGEKPTTLREMIDIVLNEYGESCTNSDEHDRQTFLNIYGEPKKNYLLLNKIEGVLDIVLGELSIRNDITPIFPSKTTSKTLFTPYTKDNSLEFLAMKKLNIYSGSSFDLNRLINNKRHIDFPMSQDIFENLSWLDEFEKPAKVVLNRIKKALNNTHQNYVRIFIQWFNSHFWSEQFGQIKFEDDNSLFNTVFRPFQQHAEVRLTITLNHISNNSTISILGGRNLSEIGKRYLTTIHPFDSIGGAKLLFE